MEAFDIINGYYNGKLENYNNPFKLVTEYLVSNDISSEYINKNFDKFNRAGKYCILRIYPNKVSDYNKYKAIFELQINYWIYSNYKLPSEYLQNLISNYSVYHKIMNMDLNKININNEEFKLLCDLVKILKYNHYEKYLEFMLHFNLKPSFSPYNIHHMISIDSNNDLLKKYLLTLNASQCKQLFKYYKNRYCGIKKLKNFIDEYEITNLRDYILLNNI